MHKIDVDEQVYTALRERGRTGDTFNGVLRDLLGLTGPAPGRKAKVRPWNHLGPLLVAGLLQPGQRLTWTRPRLHKEHHVTVDEHGNLILEDGRVCATPDVATHAIVGHPAAAWPVFCTDDGTSIQTLRDQLAANPTTETSHPYKTRPVRSRRGSSALRTPD